MGTTKCWMSEYEQNDHFFDQITQNSLFDPNKPRKPIIKMIVSSIFYK